MKLASVVPSIVLGFSLPFIPMSLGVVALVVVWIPKNVSFWLDPSILALSPVQSRKMDLPFVSIPNSFEPKLSI